MSVASRVEEGVPDVSLGLHVGRGGVCANLTLKLPFMPGLPPNTTAQGQGLNTCFCVTQNL